MIISGGDQPQALPSVEYSADGRYFKTGIKDMPEAKSTHCQVTVDETTVLVIGGSSTGVHKLDLRTGTWASIDSMKTGGRTAAPCGLVYKDARPKFVVVAGGGGSLASTEVLDLDTMKWSTGTKTES